MAINPTIYEDYVSLTLVGQVTVADLKEITDFLTKLEVSSSRSLNRLVDVSAVEDLNVNFSALQQHSSERRNVRLMNQVKTAVVTKTTEQYGMARMFEMLNEQRDTEVAIFQDPTIAIQWLRGIA